MFDRLLEKHIAQKNRSLLILGPRQVGKSTLIAQLKPDLKINLANEQEYFIFQTELSELERRLAATKARTVFIDETQRIPRLTNTVQSIIDENKKSYFLPNELKCYLVDSMASSRLVSVLATVNA